MNPWNMKIVADSSSDVLAIEKIPYASVPLKISTSEKEYVDNAELDVWEMTEDLLHYTGKSGSACPGVGDWIDAFDEATYVFVVTITSNLSGSYASAMVAKQVYEENHPDRKVFVIDSLSTGGEMKLIIEKLEELIDSGLSFEEVCAAVTKYQEHAELLFMLESLQNLANNGRVSHLAAKAVGILGIRVVGRASDVGTLEQLSKCRGEKKGLTALFQYMKDYGFAGGKVRIGHCFNEGAAEKLKEMIRAEFAAANIEVFGLRGLTSFYAEKGGLIVGYEK